MSQLLQFCHDKKILFLALPLKFPSQIEKAGVRDFGTSPRYIFVQFLMNLSSQLLNILKKE